MDAPRSFSCRSLWFTALLCATLFVAGCGDGSGDEAAYQIAVVPKSVSFDFWNSVRSGAEAAAAELDSVEVIWKGTSSESDIAGQVQIVESFINQGVDALVIAAADSRGLVPVLRQATEQGITVVTIDSNTEPQVGASFIATDNVAAARKAADLIAERTGGQGKVALVPYIAGASTSNERERGFEEGLSQHEGLDLVAKQYSDSDYTRAMSVTEDILTAHPDLDALFAANEPSVLGAAQAIKSRGLADQVTLVGFDASPREIEGVREGTIAGLIVQDPYRMGYEGVMRAYQAINGQSVPERVDSGSTVVTQENLDAFLAEREERFEGGLPFERDTSATPSDSLVASE